MATTWNSPRAAPAAAMSEDGGLLTSLPSAETAAIRRPELRALTALRFFAALMVFMDHAPVTESAAHLFGFGATGVGFFFLLSGFVLMYSHGDDFAPAIRWAQARKFYVARFARIYPAYFVALLTMTATMAAFGKVRLTEAAPAFFAQMFLVQSWVHNSAIYESLNFVGWSISVETLFYVLFPLAALALWRLNGRPRAMAATAILIVAALGVVMVHVGPAWIAWAYVLPVVRFPEFILGMLLAMAFASATRTKTGGTVTEVLAILTVALCVFVSPFAPYGLRLATWMIPSLAALLFAFATQRGAISRLLAAPALVRLGEISFAFYLVHPLALLLLAVSTRSPIAISLGGLALAVALSFLMHAAVERPARKLIVGAFANRSAREGAHAAVPAPH